MSTSQSTRLARSTDPSTSHDAVPNRRKREEQKNAILHLLRTLGPLTDHQLTYEYRKRRAQHNWPATQDDSVRKRRSELKNEGRVRSTGKTSGWGAGAPSTLWEIA